MNRVFKRKTIQEQRKLLIYKIIGRKIKIPYPMKMYYNNIIPLNIYQTWHTKNLPTLMENATSKIRELNPLFNYYLFDDNDCREFIKDNFHESVLNTYDKLIPGAYKADLWRYCILYKNGGIYLDIKYHPINNFKFINLIEKEHWVLDADKNGVYNAFMVSLPGNNMLWNVINHIVKNVNMKFYGNSPLDPTGPSLLAKYFTKMEKTRFDMRHEFYFSYENRFILYKNYYVLKSYDGYIQEHNKHKKVNHYAYLWSNRSIYK